MEPEHQAAQMLSPYLLPGETVHWTTTKSEKVMLPGLAFGIPPWLFLIACLGYVLTGLPNALLSLPSEPKWAIQVLFLAWTVGGLMFLFILVVFVAVLVSGMRTIAQIYRDPHTMIYAITSRRIMQISIGRSNPVRQIRLETCILRSNKRPVTFVDEKASLRQKLFGSDIVMSGLSADERQQALDAAKQVWERE